MPFWKRKKKSDPKPMRPPSVGRRMYSAARQSRLTASFQARSTSADAELAQSLTTMRGRARALIRDASYAKRAKTLVVNNVVGTGVGLQAQVKNIRGALNRRVNADIEEAWLAWCKADACHTGGRLHFKQMERVVMGQVFEAGEVFLRKHPARFGRSDVPIALEVIESERLADEFQSTYLQSGTENEVRMGVEVDRFFRPVAYYFRQRHPQDVRFTGTLDMIERVPADQILHLAVVDRWPQTRGEPWLHAVERRLNDMDAYSEAEIIRARVQALTAGAIETPEDIESLGERQEDGSAEMELEAGVYKRLLPGEKLSPGHVTAPNPALDPFMRYMLREAAAGIGVSYESLSRDYSQSNYSSSRLALLDDRDMWRFYQSWYICDFREPLFETWLQSAVLSRAIPSISVDEYANNIAKFERVRYKPRGWSWVDPTKEVAAYKEAVKSGFTTVSDVIAATAGGQDIEDVLDMRAEELALMDEKGLSFETSPQATPPSKEPETEPEPNTRRVHVLR